MARGDNLTREDRARGGRNSHSGKKSGRKGGRSSKQSPKVDQTADTNQNEWLE